MAAKQWRAALERNTAHWVGVSPQSPVGTGLGVHPVKRTAVKLDFSGRKQDPRNASQSDSGQGLSGRQAEAILVWHRLLDVPARKI